MSFSQKSQANINYLSRKRTPLKEITALKYHSSAMEIGEMLLECKPYVQL
ncbi:hypothetical protein HMPREF1551_01687 [Capnocytophaga sp. oral taxon 863 str. F0517]|nr:hypothetical protein HMPREF1551_01687 [Capnocytophaga sp. oral taxon 863 str. F0517]